MNTQLASKKESIVAVFNKEVKEVETDVKKSY